VYFSFFLVMYREGLPAIVLIVGFSIAALVIATLVIEPNTLAIMLTAIAGLVAFLNRRQIKRRKSVLFTIVFLWLLCVGVQRFAVPFIFQHVLQKHQVERIFSLFGKDNPYSGLPAELENVTAAKKEATSDYNVRQSKIAIGSDGVAAVFFFHIAINVCMTIGLAPVIGIPLPFVSYGGTALLTFTILLFILIRLDADRQMVLR
jgi:rod shape determining protein RodA